MGKLFGKIKIKSILALFLSGTLIMSSMPIAVWGDSTNSSTPTDVEIDSNKENDSEPVGELENEDIETADTETKETENEVVETEDTETKETENEIVETEDAKTQNTETEAVEKEEEKSNVDESEEAKNFDIDMKSFNFNFDSINANKALLKSLIENIEVDTDDPVIGQVAEELDTNEIIAGNEGNSRRRSSTKEEGQSGLTEAEKAEIIGMFKAYLDNYAKSAPFLGVQLPFFLNENDNNPDDLGILGEMLVLAGKTVEDVRNGDFGYDEVSGMILTLMLGDQLGVQAYGQDIVKMRNEALQAVKNSGAKTEAQKLLVVNDWLAANASFNMSYIMNADGSGSMQAENPQPHNNQQMVYNAVYGMYQQSILEMVEAQIREEYTYEMFLEANKELLEGLDEETKQGIYENAIAEQLASEDVQGMVHTHATAAAEGLTPEVLNYWQGSVFNTLGEGAAVCLGYSRAFSYIIQCMYPEIYLKNGRDLESADNWKTYTELYFDENGAIDLDKGYVTDAVRITFDANVTMFGQTQDNFNSDHFWNAAKVDGKWYYIDPTYNDVYVEVMIRDRVETDGNMSHLYFLLSDTTTRELYEGNYDAETGIRTLYKGIATDDSYEDSWMVRAISNTFSNGENFYYVYSSQDLINQLRDFNNSNDFGSSINTDYEYKLVRHPITGIDTAEEGTDTDFESLIDFNYKENEDDTETYARVLTKNGMVKDDYLTALFAEHKAMTEIYPSLTISTVLHNNKLYFNLSNVILVYDLATNSYGIVKEVGEFSAIRDKTIAFGGMAFSFVEGKQEGADFVFDKHPIAAIALSTAGKLKVSMATNLAYISGKDDAEYKDDLSNTRQGNYTMDREGFYGYAFEETNYNPDYSTYLPEGYESFINEEINDNDEFMWVANAVKEYDFSEVSTSTSTEGKKFVGILCEDDQHKYIEHHEVYFTKNEEDQWNKGPAYVCVECKHGIFEPTEPTEMMVQFEPEAQVRYEEKLALYNAVKESHKENYKLSGAKWGEDYKTVTFSTLDWKYSFKDYQFDALYEAKSTPLEEVVVISGNNIEAIKNEDESTTYIADSKKNNGYSGYEYYAKIIIDENGNILESVRHLVTIVDGGQGATGGSRYEKGKTVTITAGTKEGHTFKGWTSKDVEIANKDQATATFVMPEKNVTVTAEWEEDKIVEKYAVTIVDGGQGVTGQGEYEAGKTVTITAGTKEGYVFKGWTSKDVEITDKTQATATFTMPEKAVTVTAEWEEKEIEKYPVTIIDGGQGALGEGDYEMGETITITAGTKEGYVFKGWTSEEVEITDKDQATATFTMPEKAVTVTAEWTKLYPVTGVTLNKDTLTLKIGEEEILIANVLPNNADNSAVTWASSDENVATVDDNGNVSAVGIGNATITVTTVDGGFTAEASINVIKTGWVLEDDTWYYYNETGDLETGWLQLDGKWYYLHPTTGAMQRGWREIGGYWFYFNSDGTMATGWKKVNNKWYYLSKDGFMQTGWRKIGGYWFYFNEDGSMATGWKKINDTWYYMNADGFMKTGWLHLNGKWYYLHPTSGAMQVGWRKINNTWYYLTSSGAMKVGWLQISGKWYYLHPTSGAMQTGWKKINNKWYFFDTQSGVMYADTVTPDGFKVDKNGVWNG